MKTIIFLSMTFVVMLPCSIQAQNAQDILKRTDDVMYAPKDQKSDVKIILIDKKGGRQEREALYLQKGNDMRLFKFTAPSSQKGIAFLSLPGDVMYIYLPAYEKERRIAAHVKNQSFAGTDFSYDDMESKPMADEYDAALTDQNAEVWKLSLLPKTGTESSYSKLEVQIFKSNDYIKQVDYYDLAGEHCKTLLNRKLEKIGNYWAATEMEMTDLMKEHQTIFQSRNLTFDNNLSDDEFTVRKMKQ